ncbi:MAG: TDT family transporter [Peptostreptococcaceae bacterium]
MDKTNSFKENLKAVPIPLVPTFVGLATLSNVYNGLGFSLVRHIIMISAILVLCLYLSKMVFHMDTVKREYDVTVPASLYAGITMIMMIIGSYLFEFNQVIGKSIWFIAVIIHIIHILIFTYKNVIKNFVMDAFVPSWFVTYNGLLVSTVIGVPMNEPVLSRAIVLYGIGVFLIILPVMIYRLVKFEVKDAMYHTQAIILAPSSLCLVGYLNFFEPNQTVVYGLYSIVFLSLIFVLYKLPKFLSFNFNPGFAGLTFPMAIGIVASNRMSGYLVSIGNESLGNAVNQIAGIQIMLTTALIGFVVFNFYKLLLNIFKTN